MNFCGIDKIIVWTNGHVVINILKKKTLVYHHFQKIIIDVLRIIPVTTPWYIWLKHIIVT